MQYHSDVTDGDELEVTYWDGVTKRGIARNVAHGIAYFGERNAVAFAYARKLRFRHPGGEWLNYKTKPRSVCACCGAESFEVQDSGGAQWNAVAYFCSNECRNKVLRIRVMSRNRAENVGRQMTRICSDKMSADVVLAEIVRC